MKYGIEGLQRKSDIYRITKRIVLYDSQGYFLHCGLKHIVLSVGRPMYFKSEANKLKKYNINLMFFFSNFFCSARLNRYVFYTRNNCEDALFAGICKFRGTSVLVEKEDG